jgi:hypothetical protein
MFFRFFDVPRMMEDRLPNSNSPDSDRQIIDVPAPLTADLQLLVPKQVMQLMHFTSASNFDRNRSNFDVWMQKYPAAETEPKLPLRRDAKVCNRQCGGVCCISTG